MRFLTVASRYQVQLGWLRVIVDAIGDDRKGVDEVAEILLDNREHFNRWWEEAGHAPPARGIAQPATANRAARIGATYGVHDADGKGALTPLGHVLRHLGPWRQNGESPFAWQGAVRWLGLWMIFSASGDVLLEVFRSWPQDGLDSDDASLFMAEILRRLAVGASGEGRKLLRNQANRSAGEPRFARNFLIYPYLEPVRDLGYLETHGRAGGYRLTPTGRRLVDALNDGRDADAWLEDGLHRAFLLAEGAAQPQPASAAIFPLVLDHLPPGVSRMAGRAPLSMILLLAQARLVESQRHLEPRRARLLLDEAIRRASGQLRLEGDTLCWEPAAINADLWSSASAPVAAAVSAAASTPAQELPASPPSRATALPAPLPLPLPLPLAAPPPPPVFSPVPPSTPAPPSPGVVLPSVVMMSQAPAQVRWVEGEGASSARVRLWLQHVAERLRTPSAGWPLRWGGPRAALARLQSALRAGVVQEAADAEPLRLVLAEIAPFEGEALLRRAAERWGADLADVALRATLERAERATEPLVAELRARVQAGLSGAGAWMTLATATDALLEDAIALDGRSPEALLATLRHAVHQHPPAAAAAGFLEALLAVPQVFTYVRQVSGALPEAAAAEGGVEVVAAPGLSPQRQVWVRVSAHDADMALRRARAQADHAAAVLAYAARLSEPPQVISETLSPPAPPPAPPVGGLLLVPPPLVPLSLLGLPWPVLSPPEGDVGRLALAVQGLARAERATDAWTTLRGLAPEPLSILPAAGALAFAGAWLREGLYAAEAALHDAALNEPLPERLALLVQWQGEAAAQQVQAAAALPLALRAMRYPPPPPRPLAAVVDLLLTRPPEAWTLLAAQVEAPHPLAAQRLRDVVDAIAEPARLSRVAGAQHGALRALLRTLSATVPSPPWAALEPPALLPRLRAAVDPLLADAIHAVQGGEPLDLHWGAVLDRYDDLRSLAGPLTPARLLEILGAP